MNGKELIEILEKTYPRELAMEWDNPGLLAGRREKEVKRVYIGLDATEQVISDAIAWRADFLLTHHPLVIGSIRQINDDSIIGSRLIKLLQHDISYYAMHTNHDVVTMGNLAGKMMELKDTQVLEVTRKCEEEVLGIGLMGNLPKPMTLEECGHKVKEIFGLDSVKIFGELNKTITTAAISPGSGKSMISPALKSKAQVLITGDIGHHEGIDAVAAGLSVIDAGHYGVEHIFIGQMAELLKETVPELEIRQERIENPFHVL